MSDALVAERKLTIRQIATSPALWITLAVALAGGLATLAFLFWGKPDPDSGKSTTSGAMPVRTIQAQSVDSVTFPREFVGEVQARRTSDLAFERPARITHILVEDGDKVVAQQVLAQLDVSDLEIAKRKAQAAKANAEAVLTELKDGARQEVIEAAEAERDAKVAERDLAKFIRDQRSKLAGNAISPEEWNQVEAKYQSAKAEARAAQSRLDELVEGVRQEKIQAQEALVKQLNEEIEDVKLQIEKSELKAPFAGSVALRYLDEGVVVSPGQPVLRITEDDHLEVMVGIPPTTLSGISVGQEVEIVPPLSPRLRNQNPVRGNDKACIKATVRRILPEADPNTRMIPVVFELPRKDFKPGQIVRLSIDERIEQSGIWVPTQALIPGARGLWSLLVVKQVDGVDKAIRYSVSVLFNAGNRTLVSGTLESGDEVILKDGDRIISEGTQRISQGQEVEIVNSSATPD